MRAYGSQAAPNGRLAAPRRRITTWALTAFKRELVVLAQTERSLDFAACPRRYQLLLVTGAYTGLRLFEVLGLSWDDVEFAADVDRLRRRTRDDDAPTPGFSRVCRGSGVAVRVALIRDGAVDAADFDAVRRGPDGGADQ